jgi:uncharacterized protein GlcG (DUF336 family)
MNQTKCYEFMVPLKINKFEGVEKLYSKPTIGYEEARGAVEAMINEASSKPEKYWQHVCVMVVDNNGVPISVAKLDKGSYQSYEQALRKARTSALWGQDTSSFQQLISKRDWSEQTYGPDYTVCPGGVAIVPREYEQRRPGVSGIPVCLGAIGVSCAGEYGVDEKLARIGFEFIKNAINL